MIKSTEIRIGNWLKAKSLYEHLFINGYFQVHGIDKGYLFANTNNALKFDNIEPIPLSEEILLKCGFQRVEGETGPPINDIVVCFEHHYDFKIMQLHNSDKWILCDYHKNSQRFQYIHQLMNLYYAIVGEELTIAL